MVELVAGEDVLEELDGGGEEVEEDGGEVGAGVEGEAEVDHPGVEPT